MLYDGRDDQPAIWLLALAVRLDVVARLEVLVDDFALERAHRLERDGPAVVDGGLGRLVGGGPQRHSSSLAVAGGVDDDPLAGSLAAESDPVGDVLDRVDRLAVVADQQAEVLSDELAGNALLVLMDAHLSIDAGVGRNPLQQFLHA